jgi:Ca2+-binding RTX toxin-like protein
MAAVLAALPGSALAGRAEVVGKQPSFTAFAGETNRVTIARVSKTRYTIKDLGAPVTPGDGCTALSSNRVRCTAPGKAGRSGIFALGDGDDSFTTVGEGVPVFAEGQAGADTLDAGPNSSPSLVGGEGNDTLTGGARADFLFGGPGDDSLDGGSGEDQLDGGPGADTMAGGPSLDAVTYAQSSFGDPPRQDPVNVTLDGIANDGAAGEGDNVGSDVEDVYGATGADEITGDDAGNFLRLGFSLVVGATDGGRVDGAGGDDNVAGGAGPDTVDGGPGDDLVGDGDLNGATSTVSGGAGRDRIHAEDVADEDGVTSELELAPTADVISCGDGRDQLYVDSADPTPDGCEIVTQRTPTLATTRGTDGKDVILGVEGDGGNDRVIARAGSDRVTTLGGNDRIDGGTGRDKISAGEGRDTVRARDGERDRIRCGLGRDTVIADPGDRVSKDCEKVRRGNA